MTVDQYQRKGILTPDDVDTIRLMLRSEQKPMSPADYIRMAIRRLVDEPARPIAPPEQIVSREYRSVGLQRQRALNLATVAAFGIVLMVLVVTFTGQPSQQAKPSSPAATSVAAKAPKALPAAIKPPIKSRVTIPKGYVAATKVGVLSAIVRDSFVPANGPVTVTTWQKLVIQATSMKVINGPGNYNLFASTNATNGYGAGSQAYLYAAILRQSGGNPHFYLKGANNVVVEGLIPVTPKRGQQIAAEMGIAFRPYGPCNPKAATQPLTCGPLVSLMVAARYMNDIGAALSANPAKFATYKAQRLAWPLNGGPYLPLQKLTDITCVWYQKLPQSDCTAAAELAHVWRNGTLIGSSAYQQMILSPSFATLLAQAKAELVREHWLG